MCFQSYNGGACQVWVCAYVANVRSRSKWKTCEFSRDLNQYRDERILKFRSATFEITSEIRFRQCRSVWPWPLTFLKFDWLESCVRSMALLWWRLVKFWSAVFEISRIMSEGRNDLDLWPWSKIQISTVAQWCNMHSPHKSVEYVQPFSWYNDKRL